MSTSGQALTRPDISRRIAAQIGSGIAVLRGMSEQKSTEEQNQKIDAIVGDEALGYKGSSPAEHSGQDSGREKDRIGDQLADNRPDQLK
jgi:hypothetical protein